MAIYAGLHFSPVALSSVVVLSSFLPSASKLLEVRRELEDEARRPGN